MADIRPGDAVTVVGDGALGLMGVLAPKRLGAEQIISWAATGLRCQLLALANKRGLVDR